MVDSEDSSESVGCYHASSVVVFAYQGHGTCLPVKLIYSGTFFRTEAGGQNPVVLAVVGHVGRLEVGGLVGPGAYFLHLSGVYVVGEHRTRCWHRHRGLEQVGGGIVYAIDCSGRVQAYSIGKRIQQLVCTGIGKRLS